MTHRLFVLAVAFLAWAAATSSSVASEQKFEVKSVAEKKISQVPSGHYSGASTIFPHLPKRRP